GVWVLREKDGSELIGRAVLRYLPLEGRREVEVGFALYSRFWGQGLATEVGNACAAIAWNDLGVESLVGLTTLANRASQRVLLKMGLHYEREVMIDETPCSLYRGAAPTSNAAGR
ncbi:MAG: GNAT family N-acetyltransferase, partial [Myxococcota bacterium]